MMPESNKCMGFGGFKSTMSTAELENSYKTFHAKIT